MADDTPLLTPEEQTAQDTAVQKIAKDWNILIPAITNVIGTEYSVNIDNVKFDSKIHMIVETGNDYDLAKRNKLMDAIEKTGIEHGIMSADEDPIFYMPIQNAAILLDKIGKDGKFIEASAAPVVEEQKSPMPTPVPQELPSLRSRSIDDTIEPAEPESEKPAPAKTFDGTVRHEDVKALSEKHPKNEVLQSLVGKTKHRGDVHISQLEPREQRVMEAILKKENIALHAPSTTQQKTEAQPERQQTADAQTLSDAVAAVRKLARQNYLGNDADNALSAGDVIVQLGMDRNWDTQYKKDETTKIHHEVQQKMDLNDDGKVTKDEFEQVRAAAKKAGVTMDDAAATEFMKVITLPHKAPSNTQQKI